MYEIKIHMTNWAISLKYVYTYMYIYIYIYVYWKCIVRLSDVLFYFNNFLIISLLYKSSIIPTTTGKGSLCFPRPQILMTSSSADEVVTSQYPQTTHSALIYDVIPKRSILMRLVAQYWKHKEIGDQKCIYHIKARVTRDRNFAENVSDAFEWKFLYVNSNSI